MARPAALPIAVAITPTIKAIAVEVITPRMMSPFGSKEPSSCYRPNDDRDEWEKDPEDK